MGPSKKIAVIGSGASGLASLKACLEENFEAKCFEKLDDIGGLWRYRDDDRDGVASIMKSTVINTSKEMTAFSDFPPNTDLPNYMHHSKMIKYLEMYADKFQLRDHILFNHEIVELKQTEDYDETGRWTVKVKDLRSGEEYEEVFDGVMVCSGHHVFPYKPTLKGQEEFQGRVIHARNYKKATGFEDKKVTVLGLGNSGADISVELSSITDKLYLSTRRGRWITQRVGPHGLPFDLTYVRRVYSVLADFLSYDVLSRYLEWLVYHRFNHGLYNLKPNHRLLNQHPTINDSIENSVITGRIIVKNDIARLTPNGVVFVGEEDKVYECDAVILATGYQTIYPFLSQEIFHPEGTRCALYKWVFPPNLKHPSLCFIGLIQPGGSILPISENQARWYAQLMAGNVSLPDCEDRWLDIKKKATAMAKRYYNRPTFVIEVDYVPYMDEIAEQYGANLDLFRLLLKDGALFWKCFFGPCLSYQYRLTGPHTWTPARNAILTYEERVHGALQTRKRRLGDYNDNLNVRLFRLSFFLLIAVILFYIIVKCLEYAPK